MKVTQRNGKYEITESVNVFGELNIRLFQSEFVGLALCQKYFLNSIHYYDSEHGTHYAKWNSDLVLLRTKFVNYELTSIDYERSAYRWELTQYEIDPDNGDGIFMKFYAVNGKQILVATLIHDTVHSQGYWVNFFKDIWDYCFGTVFPEPDI